MNIVKIPRLGMVRGLACLLVPLVVPLAVVATPGPAQAQAQVTNCSAIHSAGFTRLRAAENKATTQGSADLEVRALFGPRIDLCEEGAYKAFMLSFKDFASTAMRALKTSRDKQLRLAISALAQAPIRVSAKEWKEATSTFRQVRSDLNATADDIGFNSTPLLGQLLETMGRIGAPTADQSSTPPSASVQPPSAGTGTGTTAPVTGGVQQVRIPTEPLPPWAVIKLYELRDHIKAQDQASSERKIQDVINWIEGKAPTSP